MNNDEISTNPLNVDSQNEVEEKSANGIYASDFLKKGLTDYAFYTLESKLPHVMDGLLQLHRRILWSIRGDFELKQVAARMGDILAKYHPHGDASITDGISTLAKPYKFTIPLLDKEGSVGTYSNPRAAAPRYLDTKCSKFTADVFFDDMVEAALPLVLSVYQHDMEPKYLIPKIPTALILGVFGIAMGYKSDTVQFNLNSVCQLVVEYVRLRKDLDFRNKIPSLLRYLVPDTTCLSILQNSKQLMEDYKKGIFNARIYTDGMLKISPSAIIILSFPDGMDAMAQCEFLSKQLDEKDSFMNRYFQRVVSLSGKLTPVTQCHIQCDLKRGVDPFEILDEFKKVARISSSWIPQISYLDISGRRCSPSPIEILEIWYNERYRYLMAGIKYKQNRYIEEIQELDALNVVSENLDEVYALFKNAENVNVILKTICNRFNLTYFQAKYIGTYPLNQMTRLGKEDLRKKKEAKIQQLKDIQEQIFHIDDQIIADAMQIKKEYGSKAERRCLFPNYKGIIQIGEHGFSQYFGEQEVQQACAIFGAADIQVQSYPTGNIHKYILSGNRWFTDEARDLPKQLYASRVVVSKRKLKNLVIVRDKTICYVDHLVQVDPDSYSVPVGDNIWVFNQDNTYAMIRTNTLPLRKVATATGNLTLINQVFDCDDVDVIAVHCNPKEVNTVRMARLSASGGRLKALATGKLKVIGIFKISDPMMFTIPSDCLSRTAVRHIKIDNPSLLGEYEMVRVAEFTKIKGTDFYTYKR